MSPRRTWMGAGLLLAAAAMPLFGTVSAHARDGSDDSGVQVHHDGHGADDPSLHRDGPRDRPGGDDTCSQQDDDDSCS
jgi:hypothetical protein